MSDNYQLENDLLQIKTTKNCARIITFKSKPEGKTFLNNSRVRMGTDKRFGAGALCVNGRAIDDLAWEFAAAKDSVICKATDQNLSLKKTYFLNPKKPCIEFGIEAFGDLELINSSGLETGISLPGVKNKDTRLLCSQSSSGQMQSLPLSSMAPRYHSLPEHSGWMMINDRATGETLIIINGQCGNPFRGGIFKQHVTLLCPVCRNTKTPGAKITGQVEYWLVTKETYPLVKSGKLLTKDESTRLVKALAQIYSPAKKVYFERIVKNPVYRNSGGKGDLSLKFSWKDGRDTREVSAEKGKILIPAGQPGRWQIDLYLKSEIREGGSILLRRHSATSFGCCMQVEDEKQEEFLKIQTTAKASLQAVLNPVSYLWQKGTKKKQSSLSARIIVTKGRLQKGARVSLTLGSLKAGLESMIPAMGLPLEDKRDRMNNQLEIYIDPTGDKGFQRVGPAVVCQKVANKPGRLLVTADTLAVRGKMRLVVSLEDIYNNLCADYEGKAIVSKGAKEIGKEISLKNGFGEALLNLTTGAEQTRIEVSLPEFKLTGQSNVVCRDGLSVNKRLYWGEMHVHTNLSHDGQGGINQTYANARDLTRLDFCAVADHTANITVGDTMPAWLREYWQKTWWKAHQEAVDKFYTPGKFVPILAQEIHPGDGGDHNVFYPSSKSKMIIPLIGHRDEKKTGLAYRDLYTQVRKRKAVIVPHVGGGEKCWLWHDPKVERMAEIASIHGCFESFAQDGLARGYRFGFVFGSDCHLGLPSSGAYNSDSFYFSGHNETVMSSGFTAALSRNLTTGGIIKALQDRSCYACKGRERPVIEFKVNDTFMGGECKSQAAPWIQGRVMSGKKIRSAHIIRNQSEIKRYLPGKNEFTFSFEDKAAPCGENYYYLRIVFSGDELAWTSPIWVSCKGGKPAGKKMESPWNRCEIDSLAKINKNPATEFEAEANKRLKKLAGDRFCKLKGLRVVDDGFARYARLLGYNQGGEKISAHYFFEFIKPLITISDGWDIFDTKRLRTLQK